MFTFPLLNRRDALTSATPVAGSLPLSLRMRAKAQHVLLCLALFSGLAQAQAPAGPDPALTKMRDQLKATTLQLRTAQSETATMQAAKDEAEAANKDLKFKLDKALKDSADDKLKADKVQADLTAKGEDQAKQIDAFKAAIAKWQLSYGKVETYAKTKETERARLAGEVIRLDRKVADRERKNIELYQLGTEILTRYKNFGLGRALLAREPFTGLAKVKLETAIQDYADKLMDQKIKPEGSKAAEAAKQAPAPATPAPAPATQATAPAKEAPKSDAKPKS